MQFDTSGGLGNNAIPEETIAERIETYFFLYHFNLMTGDYTLRYCEQEVKRLEKEEDYAGCAGVKKAMEFYRVNMLKQSK